MLYVGYLLLFIKWAHAFQNAHTTCMCSLLSLHSNGVQQLTNVHIDIFGQLLVSSHILFSIFFIFYIFSTCTVRMQMILRTRKSFLIRIQYFRTEKLKQKAKMDRQMKRQTKREENKHRTEQWFHSFHWFIHQQHFLAIIFTCLAVLLMIYFALNE